MLLARKKNMLINYVYNLNNVVMYYVWPWLDWSFSLWVFKLFSNGDVWFLFIRNNWLDNSKAQILSWVMYIVAYISSIDRFLSKIFYYENCHRTDITCVSRSMFIFLLQTKPNVD